jgi:hypothetical protein
MPRYFFTIHRQDRVEDDRDGTYLPDAEAALSYADYTIRELRKKKRLQGRSVSGDDRRGSSPADGFILAFFPGLLKLVLVASAVRCCGLQ